jgi:hypothetical protein
MSVGDLSMESDMPKMKRKVSFNEKNNTVHRYRKNSRQEKKFFEEGGKTVKKLKK